MISRLKKLALATLVATPLTLASFTGTASAINSVNCNDESYLKLTITSNSLTYCFANAGYTDFNGNVKRISTGNNAIIYHDKNGDKVSVPKWTNRTFPTVGWVEMKGVEIL